MNLRHSSRRILLGTSLLALGGLAEAAMAAEPADIGEQVIVTGTRETTQTQYTALSPVDVIDTAQVQSTAAASIDQTLATLVPSFNVKRLPSSDGTQFIRPASLNNLSPDMTLVLVNGKRFHRSAFLGSYGSQATDLAQISSFATGRIELLRDGASAQYGSDAIAGVINILLNKDTGLATYGQLSQYYYGDGLTLQAGARGGIELPHGGHVVLTAEYQKANETSRTHQRDDAKTFQAAHPTLAVPNPVQRWGNPDMQGIKTALDASENLTDYVEAYAFATLAASRQHNDINWRNPDFTSTIYKVTSVFPGFDLKTIWPTGFTPDEGVNALDAQMAAGIRHTGSHAFTWDTSVSYGVNNSRFFLNNSINASLGPDSPHRFNLGHMIESEIDVNGDAVYRWDLPFLAEPLNVAFGAEYRGETFQMKAGDPASYQAGPGAPAPYGLAAGSNGFPGIADTQAGSWTQTSYAGYLDLQAQVTKSLQLEVALRDEDYSDFGNTFNYKFGGRYEVIPGLAFRGSYSTGFKAPSPGQNNATSTSQGLDTVTLQLFTNGRLSTSNPVAQYFGAKPLQPETSKTATAGIAFETGNGFSGSIDAFKTDVQSRFSTSKTITIDSDIRAKLVAAGIPGATSFTSVNFFTNDFNTMTRGIEVTGNYTTDLGAGRLLFNGAYSYTATKVTAGTTAAATDPSQKRVFEQGVPQHNASATASYAIGDFEFMSRVRFYGPWSDSATDKNGLIFQRFGSMEFVDLAITCNITDKASIRLGAENIGDFYPEKAVFQASRGIEYSRNAPYDVNGGNYYLRYDVKF